MQTNNLTSQWLPVFSQFPINFPVLFLFTKVQQKILDNSKLKADEDIKCVSNVFSTRFENFLPFSSNSKLSSVNSFSLKESKICCLGKG